MEEELGVSRNGWVYGRVGGLMEGWLAGWKKGWLDGRGVGLMEEGLA